MKRTIAGLVAASLLATMTVTAQTPTVAAVPFKLATVRYQGRTFAALVLRDSIAVELQAAGQAINQPIPNDLLAIVDEYDNGVGNRIRTVARNLSLPGAQRPAYAHDLKSVEVLVPFLPRTFLNGATNYPEHATEMSTPAGRLPGMPAAQTASRPQDRSLPGIWQRAPDDKRRNPYLFLSPPNIVIANGQPVQVPTGRSRIDWECELLAIIGKPTRRVPLANARDYIWGYSVINDVSDRQMRDGDSRGMDWFVQKGQDSFKPFGPFIVPKEFVDPLNTKMKFVLSGKVMQEDNSGNAIHSFYDYVHYASNLLTLRVGDVIALGTPGGVGTARTPPIYMKPGDVAECTYEGVGTLTSPIVAEPASAAR